MKLKIYLQAIIFSFSGLLFSASSTLAQVADSNQTCQEQMTLKQAADIFRTISDDVVVNGSNIQFTFQDTKLAFIAAPNLNRMRIIAPIIAVKDLSVEQMSAAMISNFHLALDARYAIGNDFLYALFIHPLSELNANQLESAARQVATLHKTFGSTFTSGELSFGVSVEEGPQA